MDSNHIRQEPTDQEVALSNAYLETLLLLGRCTAEVCPPIGSGVQETLLRLRRRLAFDPQTQAITDAQAVVDNTVRDFSRRAKEHIDTRALEASHLFSLTNRTADLLAARDRSYLELLREVTRKMQFISTCEDPGEVRRNCDRVAIALTQLTETFQDDSAIALAQLRRELSAWDQRRKDTDEFTSLDPVTGLFSRAEIEHRIRQALVSGRQFCILKLGVHEFSGLAEAHGIEGIHLMMKAAADKLNDQIRPRDVVGQWDDHTFLLLFFNCPIEKAESRAQQISAWLSGDYRLMIEAQVVHADVQLTAAATETQPGESEAEFVARAEALSPVVLLATAG
jgi:GGDEF domain-containing protein